MEFNNLNIDRLHYNIQGLMRKEKGISLFPGSGKTFGYLYLMLGEIWLGDLYRDFLYVAKYRHQSQSAAFSFSRLLTSEGIAHRVEQHNLNHGTLIVIENTAQRFRFVHYDAASMEQFWIGTRFWRVFLDVRLDDKMQESFDKVISMEVKISGGDII